MQLEELTIDDAVNQMPDIEAMESANPNPEVQRALQERDDSGRFRAREPEQVQPAAKDETSEDPAAKAKAEAPETEDDDDPFVEFAAEEGKEPVREKLSKVWEGFQRSQTLEQELQTAKTQQRALLPAEVEQVVAQVHGERTRLISQLDSYAKMISPEPPDLSLVNNPNSARYNPELFASQLAQYQTAKARLAEVSQEIENQQAIAKQEQEAVLNARAQREWQRIQQVWPEYAQSKDGQIKARSELKQRYGFDDETINSVIDSRFYALAKDALAFHQAKAKEAEAVKVVKAKPKLVTAVARQTATAKQRSSQDGLKRLQSSGSLEDAMAALDGIL